MPETWVEADQLLSVSFESYNASAPPVTQKHWFPATQMPATQMPATQMPDHGSDRTFTG
ncbi:MAG: hypothetical protein L6435_14555 [Anaerolineae bacterium]|nr:hypothetical protein [Anaerolineae bacterium]